MRYKTWQTHADPCLLEDKDSNVTLKLRFLEKCARSICYLRILIQEIHLTLWGSRMVNYWIMSVPKQLYVTSVCMNESKSRIKLSLVVSSQFVRYQDCENLVRSEFKQVKKLIVIKSFKMTRPQSTQSDD
jgi:hypothetical protein